MSQPARSVAIIGASSDRRKYGNKAVRAFAAEGWQVFPIHPRDKMVEGLTAYPSLQALPFGPDAVSLYVPPTVGRTLLADIASRRPAKVWVNPGAGDAELRTAAAKLQLPVSFSCSILEIGHSPHEFPDA